MGQYKLTLSFSNMGPHIGQELLIRVTERPSGEEVGRKTIASIPSASFDVELYVLILNHSYNIDFYVDFNGNRQYDAPPNDHAWRLELNNITGDATVKFSHNTNFTDIGWSTPFNLLDYSGIWTGYWINRTYGSTAEVNALVEIVPDSFKVRVTSTSTLILGNPALETKMGEGTIAADFKSITVNAPPPWTGSATAVQGELSGIGTAPEFGGVNLEIHGNFGPSQMITAFFITGSIKADGIIVMTKQKNGVDDARLAEQPYGFKLLQNYPNPFNPSTTIGYELDKEYRVSVEIFNVAGERMTVLKDGLESPGNHSVVWDGTDDRRQQVSAGFYLCRIQGGSEYRTIRMLLLK